MRAERLTPGELVIVFQREWERLDARDQNRLAKALDAIRNVGRAEVSAPLPARREPRGREDRIAAVRPKAERIIAAVAERHGLSAAELKPIFAARGPGRVGVPVVVREVTYALRLAGLLMPDIAAFTSVSDASGVLKVLKSFRPTAEQERALRAIAGVELAAPALRSVA